VRRNSSYLTVLAAFIASLSVACERGGVGDPCIPEDEYRTTFGGFDESEVNVESRSFQCETRMCLVSHFKGRVSCPYGNKGSAPANACYIPGTNPRSGGGDNRVEPEVEAQLLDRKAEDAVYCSCRCDGPDPNAQYCECPSGFTCREQIQDQGLEGARQLVGSYCIRDGTEVEDAARIDQAQCRNVSAEQCGPVHPYGLN
jgi:hypothetical protein